MSVREHQEYTVSGTSFVADDASALTDPNVVEETATTAFLIGNYEKGFELFGDDVAGYINSFGDIETQTSNVFNAVHDMIMDAPCMEGYQEPEEGDSKIEVEFNGNRDLIMYSSVDRSSVDEVAFQRKRKGLFKGLSRRKKN